MLGANHKNLKVIKLNYKHIKTIRKVHLREFIEMVFIFWYYFSYANLIQNKFDLIWNFVAKIIL